MTDRPLHYAWQAHGGNLGAECDQAGRPIEPGRWYVIEDQLDEITGAEFVAAGPFDTKAEAEAEIERGIE